MPSGDGRTAGPVVGKAFALRVLTTLALAAGVGVLVVAAWIAHQVLLVIFLGVLFAILLDGVAQLIARVVPMKPRHVLRLLLLLVVAGTVLFGVLFGPDLANQFVQFFRALPQALDAIRDSLGNTSWGRAAARSMPDAEQFVSSMGPSRIAGLFSSLAGGMTALFIVLFVGVYAALDPPRYVDNAVRVLPPAHRERGREVLDTLRRALTHWLLGRLADMLVLATLTTLGLLLVGIPFAIPLGITAGLLCFVPYVGPLLSVFPAVLVASQADVPNGVLLVIALYSVAQFVESYFITPLIEQRAVDVPPALGLAIQAVFGMWAGVVGVIVATPVLVVIIVLIQSLWIEGKLGETVRVIGEPSREKHE